VNLTRKRLEAFCGEFGSVERGSVDRFLAIHHRGHRVYRPATRFDLAMPSRPLNYSCDAVSSVWASIESSSIMGSNKRLIAAVKDESADCETFDFRALTNLCALAR
jgi:hypothetical protein